MRKEPEVEPKLWIRGQRLQANEVTAYRHPRHGHGVPAIQSPNGHLSMVLIIYDVLAECSALCQVRKRPKRKTRDGLCPDRAYNPVEQTRGQRKEASGA